MIKEDELRDLLQQNARDIAAWDTNPSAWLSWIVYLLARLEERATNENPANRDSFVEMLSSLQDEIRNRLRTGGWH